MTRYFDWNDGINKEELEIVRRVLLNDGVVIFPTETVYGIAASAFSEEGINKVYKAKQRPKDKAINIMVSDICQISKFANIRNDIERKIIDNFMPGELTIILDKKENFGKSFTLSDTLGIRIPSSKIALEILKSVDIPLIVSSANISNHPSGIDSKLIYNDFADKVDIIIDGGVVRKGIPSTIVKVCNNEIEVLREGKITIDEIRRVL